MFAMEPADRIILALDGMGEERSLAMVESMPDLRWVKVGLELFTEAGPAIVSQMRQRGLRVFLDLKFHDIPATMAGACRSAAGLGAELITVHACAGVEGLQQALAGAAAGAQQAGLSGPPQILAVTVLTSWKEERLQQELLLGLPLPAYVSHLAALAADAGIGGCVCSPLELAALRASYAEPFALVTPGIRPGAAAVNDQARVMTPGEAVRAGASQLVIGRPITTAAEPAAAFARCCAELVGI
jgi:orotidine-5'-phosphate decarboxylase